MAAKGTALCCRRVGRVALARGGLAPAGEHGPGCLPRFPWWPECRAVMGTLRFTCPPAMPVVVRTARLPANILGNCARRPRRFVIQLNRYLTDEQAVETLLHEWAHALAWNFSLDQLAKAPGIQPDEFDRASHDEAWGCAFSRVWRAYSGHIGGGNTGADI